MRAAGLFAVLTLLGGTASAQTGFLDRTVDIEGHVYRYQIYIPVDYTPKSAWPVVVALHGNGRQGTDGLKQTGPGFAAYLRDSGQPFPALVVFPQAQPGTRWLYPEMQALVMAQLRQTIKDFRVDTARVYLQGYSMGGSGALRLAFHHPTTFAALVVIAGRVENRADIPAAGLEIDRRANPFLATTDPFATLATTIKSVPIWLFHGEADSTVEVAQSQRLAAALQRVGAQFHYTEYAGVDHLGVSGKAYAETALFKWLFAQHR
ncbi:MAG: PHB depolymerase family esterase [Gemmatimonas sp.]